MRGQRDCISFTSELLSLKRRGQAAHRTPVWDVTPRKQRIRTQPPPPKRWEDHKRTEILEQEDHEDNGRAGRSMGGGDRWQAVHSEKNWDSRPGLQ